MFQWFASIKYEAKFYLKCLIYYICDLLQMFSDMPADHILATHKREVESTSKQAAEMKIQQKRQTHFSTGIRMVSYKLMGCVECVDKS